jgi:predicted small metal-binding protein
MRKETYEKAFILWGEHKQLAVAIEELAELQKEICKHIRNRFSNIEKIAEETADAKIMIEQIEWFFNIKNEVEKIKEKKLERLQNRILAKEIEDAKR